MESPLIGGYMIVGAGDIASVLTDKEDVIYFASGVSNSQETRESEYEREINLLFRQQSQGRKLVYFSSLSVFYSNSRYSKHKRYMEELIKISFPSYCIVRIGNILWGTNPHTFINAFRANPNLPIQDTYRYVVDKDEFCYWIGMIPEWSCELNVPGKRMKVQEIIKTYVHS